MIDPLQCTIGGVHYFLWDILFLNEILSLYIPINTTYNIL
jgi:hypothetical protein